MTNKVLLWLDDYRDPFTEYSEWVTMFSPIGRDVKIVWVQDYNEFTNWITENGLPDAICFDHDLADEHYCTPESLWDDYEASKAFQEKQTYTEMTGYNCATWLIEYCRLHGVQIPLWASHSANPVGRDNINRALTNYFKSF